MTRRVTLLPIATPVLVALAGAATAGCDGTQSAADASTADDGSRAADASVATDAAPGQPDGGPDGGGRGSAAHPIELPACDPEDPDVLLIDDPDDLGRLGSDDHRVFCVTPGDYTAAGTLTITSDGAEGSERWLRWFDPDAPDDDAHPYHMEEARQALLDRITFSDAHHWVVDRIRFDRGPVDVTDGSSRIVLNRILFWEQVLGSRTSVRLTGESRQNVIQNSVIAKTPPTPFKDAAGVYITNSDENEILSNEIFDIPGDCIQTGQSQAHARTTIIRDNDLYSTPALYTDCEGNLDPDGDCGGHENAIDIKAHWGPNDDVVPREDYMVIENNRMWGWRGTDNAVGGTGSGTPGENHGTPLVIHYWTSRAVEVTDNQVWDTDRGYTVSKNEDRGPICCHEVTDNVFDVRFQGLKPRHIDQSRYERNLILGAEYGANMTSTANDNELVHNVLLGVDDPVSGGDDSSRAHDNAFFGGPAAGDGDNLEGAIGDAAHEDLCFTIRRITDPVEHCIERGRVTASSPHASWFGR